MNKEIVKTISVDPQCLDSNIKSHLLEKVKASLTNTCSKEYGYISNVIKIVGVVDNTISASSEIMFKLKILVEALKPEVGTTLTGTATMVLQHGVFIEVDKKLKALIPSRNMEGFEFDKVKSVYKKGDVVYKAGDKITFKIASVRYEKNNFSCIGTLN